MESRQRRRVDAGPEDVALRAGADEERVRQEVDALFSFAVSNFRKTQPRPGTLSDTCALYDFQQEALGWMLYREQYTTTQLVPLTRPWSRDKDSIINTNKKVRIVVPLDETGGVCGAGPPGEPLAIDSVRGGMNLTAMGLGKTVQMIALIATNTPPSRRRQLGTLVIMPSILLDQWTGELKRCAPQLSVYQLHGRDRQNDPDFLRRQDVVLTSYSTFALEMDEPRFASLSWWRVILDEAHIIRNVETKIALACHRVLAQHRFVMTGTPVQNAWRDLFSLFKFLRIRPYGEFDAWMQLVERPLKSGTDNERDNALARLRSVVRRLAIRHTKSQPNPDATIRVGATLETEDPESLFELAGARVPVRQRTPLVWEVDEVATERFVIVPREMIYRQTPRLTLSFRDYFDNPDALTLRREYVYLPPTSIRYQNLGFNFTDDSHNRYYQCMYEPIRQSGEVPFVLLSNLRRFCVNPRLVEMPIDNDCSQMWPRRDPAWGKPYIESVNSKTFESSVKLDTLVRDLQRASERDAAVKSVVFSEWTDALDLAELRLQRAGWYSEVTYRRLEELYRQSPAKTPKGFAFAPRYVRIDGKTKQEMRAWALEQVASNEGVKLILLSLLAAGVGLNLVRASDVYFLEPSFNPGNTSQAIDRVGRIGQQRTIHVTIYITEDTVEQKIVDLANYKRRIADQTLETVPVSREVVTRLV